MENLPFFIPAIFLLSVIITFLLIVSMTKKKTIVITISLVWLGITGILSAKGFFTNMSAMPPRLFFTIAPAVIVIIVLLITKNGRGFIDGLDLRSLTLLHIVRVPVELVLFSLAAQKAIPEIMTFEGRNLDILSGLSAPVIYFACFKNGKLVRRRLLLAWNFICLGLLINIVTLAILSAPFPFQKFAFDQPNLAVFYFPYTWLPAFIVTAVLFSHVAAIRKLLINDHSLSPASPSTDPAYAARS